MMPPGIERFRKETSVKKATRTGVMQSVAVGNDVEAFLGIPYAKPPAGERCC